MLKINTNVMNTNNVVVINGEAILEKLYSCFREAIFMNAGTLLVMEAKQTFMVCWQEALNLEEYMVIVIGRC